tara:strand:- start:15 stop:236 length:222 start_codon:yes stop_codon:yes gene_type:complete
MDMNIAQSFIAGGSSGIIIGSFYMLYKILKHSSCRSNCCGLKSSLSVDLEKGLISTNSSNSDTFTTEKKNIIV